MEVSGYRVEIKEGKHICNPSANAESTWWKPFSYSYTNIENNDRSYVEMEDGKHYGVSLYNGHATRCYATVTIDGKVMGKWLLEPYQRAVIERPVEIDKKFTFFKVSSAGGQAAGLTKFDSNNGLVQVEFMPEKKRVRVTCCSANDDDDLECFSNEQSLECETLSFNSRPATNHSSRSLGRSGMGAQSQGINSRKKVANLRNHNDNFFGAKASPQYEEGGTGLLGKSNQLFGVADNLTVDPDASVTITLRLVGRKTATTNYDAITPLSQIPRKNAVPPPIW
jgi:hypothetical protein